MHSDKLEVQITGSSGNPYVVTFIRDEDGFITACTCPAGEKRTHCKHRLSLFSGDLTAVRGDIPPHLSERLSIMVKGTKVESALLELGTAEAESTAATDRVKRAKKQLDRVMHE